MDGRMFCSVCGVVDEYYDEDSLVHHNDTPKHISNRILEIYNDKKRHFSKNRDGVKIIGSGECFTLEGVLIHSTQETDHQKIRIMAQPCQKVRFLFSISNDMRNEDLLIIGVMLGHPQPQFIMNEHPFIFGETPNILQKKTILKDEVTVNFESTDIGQFEMPIIFTIYRESDERNIIIIREMVVLVSEEHVIHPYTKSPFTNQEWERPDHIIRSVDLIPHDSRFKIPKLLKILLPHGIEENSLERIKTTKEVKEKLQLLIKNVRIIFETGTTRNNYMFYFHHLLWWEEIVAKIHLKKFNMFNVVLEFKNEAYHLEVPGLAEKRPSLMRGDRVFIRPREDPSLIFESSIIDLSDTHIQLAKMDEAFHMYYNKDAFFDVRFLLTRVPCERMHVAVNSVFSSKQECRVFPQPTKNKVAVKTISKFYNPLIKRNPEQKSAVEHMVSGTSGKAPYIVFGPPGTGKTMTIVEAIVQLVVSNSKNRIMVCTDSNMAADHIAAMLLQYNKKLNINNYLLRANSQTREWSVMPSVLAPVSNGTSFETFHSVTNVHVSNYRIFVTTLLHAAKYDRDQNGYHKKYKLQMTHLFIDEAAQASEPATLIPITSLLSPNGHLVLAGDPQQLGPVCLSRETKHRGLSTSLMERLRTSYDSLYNNNPNYITMLVKNFRSDPDILLIPNELFYDNCLQALAKPDPLSKVSILNLPGGERAIVFHAVNSKEQRMGNAPSFFNEMELEMLKKYIKALVEQHHVAPKDIGIIAPYIRQVYKMKSWLASSELKEIEVGTVESFQGKEKRVILVSTVRANCRLLDYDAKYGLGFLVDDKRYNVALTRAKAKLVIIGNPACLTRDIKWRRYMSLCSDLNSYHGIENQQLQRTSQLLTEITRTRFERCRISRELTPTTPGKI